MNLGITNTGCSKVNDISFDLITPARRHPMKWDRSPFSPDIRTFWYIVSKNSNRFYIIFTDLCVGGLVFWIFVKIHWILRIKQTSVLFCNYLHNESSDLHEILCGSQLLTSEPKSQISWRSVHKCASTSRKRACTRVVNVHTRDITCARMFTTRALAFMDGSSWNSKLKLTR